jgi:prepilin-type N-terminal cleavage/methylation domain-containing protein
MIKPRQSARPGFTLIEIICVVVIFAIAAAIVFAGISSQGDLQAESAARSVMADLLYAQNEAISTQQYVYVYFNTAGSHYYVYSPWGTALTNPVSQTAYSTSWSGQNWSVTSVNLDGAAKQPAMYFNALGQPYSCDSAGDPGTLFTTSGTIVIGSGGRTVTITIQPSTGDITVQ